MRQVRLSNRAEQVLVDDEDFAQVSRYYWHGSMYRGALFAARNTSRPRKTVYMHTFILGLDAPASRVVVKHRNGNTLDNRRANLVMSAVEPLAATRVL